MDLGAMMISLFNTVFLLEKNILLQIYLFYSENDIISTICCSYIVFND